MLEVFHDNFVKCWVPTAFNTYIMSFQELDVLGTTTQTD